MSTAQLHHLSLELTRLRVAAGMTKAQVTQRLDWGVGRLGYIEDCKWQRADVAIVGQLLDLYGVEAAEREALLDLARQSRSKGQWWADYKDLFPKSLPSFEDVATMIRTVEITLVPGLLQTRAYAAAVIAADSPGDSSDIERKVEARLARQQILDRPTPPDFWAVISEAALYQQVGGLDAMREQIRHLLEMAARPRINVVVLPFTAGAHAAMMGAFSILDFGTPQQTPLVYVEGAVGATYMSEPQDVQRHTWIFQEVISSAMTPDQSIRHLAELQDHLSE